MIKLTRTRTTSAIPSGLRGRARVKKNLALLKLKREKGQLASKEFKSSQWKPAKTQLRAESNNKCAYCEADTKVVAHGDVEHFRPKTVYWWLAYCYDNYLYSCQICNQTFKSNNFPVSGSPLKGPRITSRTRDSRLETLAETLTPDPLDEDLLESFIDDAIAENSDLIDPYVLDPDDWLVWNADDDEKEVVVKVKPRARGRAAKQKAIDEFYGLNREELRKVRYQDYKTAETLKRSIVALADVDPDLVDEIGTRIRAMMADEHRFAGMIRFFVNKEWKIDVDE